MRIEELVSDWELEEIRQELRHGEAPDIVAFRHGIPMEPVREYKRKSLGGPTGKTNARWTQAELSFVRDNWPNHDKGWEGWKMLDRTWDAIKWCACRMGVKRKGNSANEGWRKSNGAFMRPRKG